MKTTHVVATPNTDQTPRSRPRHVGFGGGVVGDPCRVRRRPRPWAHRPHARRSARPSPASACSSSRVDRAGSGSRLRAACAPGGEVVVSDIAWEMTAIASERAHALGLDNVRARVLDIEAIDEPDRSYDVVLCRDGVQFATEPERAAREIRRVLRPGWTVRDCHLGPPRAEPMVGNRARLG